MNLDSEKQSKLQACRQFSGPASEFWTHYCALLRTFGEADRTCILVKNDKGQWQALASSPEGSGKLQLPIALADESFDLWIERTKASGISLSSSDPVREGTACLMALQTGTPTEVFALLHLSDAPAAHFESRLDLLLSLSDVPANYTRNVQLNQSMEDIRRCVETLDTLNVINAQTRFYAMSMALCNEIKNRFHCSRVSLGSYKAPYIKATAISNMDRFEPKMDIVQQLEATMEEAIDQGEDICFPAGENDHYITRDHAKYSEAEGGAFILTLALRIEGKIIGALCFERSDRAFNEGELAAFRVLADQCARRVHDLQQSDRWFGAKMAAASRDFFGGYLGHTKTWNKVFAILTAIVLLALFFVRVEYRVEAPFIVRSNQLIHLPAPFAGYIETVDVEVGDFISKDQLMLQLDTSELLVQRANRIAEIQRYASQAENAEAEKRLADMRISLAQKQQSEAALQLVDYQLRRAELRAPFDGIIVEGNLTDKIGAPVEKGDILMRLTRLEDLYVEMKVDERDIHEIQDSENGEFAFASKPDEHYAFALNRIEPVAVAGPEGSIFYVHGDIEVEAQDWWRPGMSGVAKINTEKRSLIWIFTHRLVDFLRIQLWW